MLPYELFNGHEAAHFMYAKTCNRDAVDILDHRFEDGSWRQAPEQWFDLLLWLGWQNYLDENETNERAEAFSRAVGAPIDPGSVRFTEQLVEALRTFTGWACDTAHAGRAPIMQILVASLLETIGPGDAGIIAGILDVIPDEIAPVRDLGTWLLCSGVAELRNPARQRLLLRLLLMVEDPASLATAVRMVARGGPPLTLSNQNPNALSLLWDRLERFEPCGASRDEVGDLLSRFAHERGRELYPQPERHPRCVRILVQGWLRNTYEGAPFNEIAATALPHAEDFEGVPLAALHQVARQLRSLRCPPFEERPTIAAWTSSLSVALICSTGGIQGLCNDPEARFSLQLISGWPQPAVGVEEALREALNNAPDEPHTGLARQILDSGGGAHFRVWAAIMAFQGSPTQSASVVSPLPEAFRQHLRNLIHTPWRPVHGLDDACIFRGARDIRFERLERDLQVDVRESTLLVHDDYPRRLANSGRPLDEQLALLSLYVVHEAIHHVQQIGEKEAVGRLRRTGNEQALMHLDLSADHAAALIVAAAVPRWSLLWLKDVQGRSITDFPSTALHAFGSHMRKATRLAGLRLDYLVRRHRPDLDVGEGYVYAGLGPIGGPFHVLTSGPPVRLLLENEINDTQAKIIMASLERSPPRPPGGSGTDAPDPEDPLTRLDRTLRDVLGVKQA